MGEGHYQVVVADRVFTIQGRLIITMAPLSLDDHTAMRTTRLF